MHVQVTCGSDVVAVCGRWDGLRVQYIMWGAFFFLFSHFLIFMFCLSVITLLRLQSTSATHPDSADSDVGGVKHAKAGSDAGVEAGVVTATPGNATQ